MRLHISTTNARKAKFSCREPLQPKKRSQGGRHGHGVEGILQVSARHIEWSSTRLNFSYAIARSQLDRRWGSEMAVASTTVKDQPLFSSFLLHKKHASLLQRFFQ